MAWIDRDAIRTTALRQGFKDEVLPYLKSLGFKKQSPPLAGGRCQDTWGNNWSRRRGEFMDEVHIEWRTLQRPFFMIEFWTDQTERMTLYDPRTSPEPWGEYYARIPAGRTNRGAEIWFGGKMPLEKTLFLAKERLSDLDDYLKTGYTGAYIDLCFTVDIWQERPSYLFRDRPLPKRPRLGFISRNMLIFESVKTKRFYLGRDHVLKKPLPDAYQLGRIAGSALKRFRPR